MRWLTDPELMARWIVGAERAESDDGHTIRLTVATRVARQRVAATYIGETVERTVGRFVRRYRNDQPEGPIDRTITYELERRAEGCMLACFVSTDVEGIPASVVRASKRQQQRSLRRSLDRLALVVSGREPTRWRLAVDRRSVGQPL